MQEPVSLDRHPFHSIALYLDNLRSSQGADQAHAGVARAACEQMCRFCYPASFMHVCLQPAMLLKGSHASMEHSTLLHVPVPATFNHFLHECADPASQAGYRDRFLAAAAHMLRDRDIPADLQAWLDTAANQQLPQGMSSTHVACIHITPVLLWSISYQCIVGILWHACRCMTRPLHLLV